MQPTKFLLSGDPVKAQDGSAGWVDGMLSMYPSDRIFVLVAGPFTMAGADTQEMVVALAAGIGPDPLSSITVLRSIDDSVQALYNRMTGVGPVLGIAVPRMKLPGTVQLWQNFPNPFNPSTTIHFGLPYRSHVTLAVFNALGQKVATLVQGEKEAGHHEVKFDGTGLSSGVYFYRMTAGDYEATKKLLLLR